MYKTIAFLSYLSLHWEGFAYMLARETDSRRKDNWGLRVVRILPLVSDTNVLEVTNAVD